MALKRVIFIIAFFTSFSIANAQNFPHDSIIASKTSTSGLVVLVDFKAVMSGDKIKLKWTTSSEKNNKEFYVYRSMDEVHWYIVANIPGKANSTVLKHYESIDETVSGGINFYKLAWIDMEGIATALKAVKIDVEDKSKQIKVIPNNISSTIKLESAEPINSIELELTDMLERSYNVPFVTDSSHEITIITGGLNPGIYFLKCYLNKNRHAVKKVLIMSGRA